MDLLSENIEPKDWKSIADSVREVVQTESVQGGVVLHGTDTMTYTANALSFLLADVPARVVVTGANISPDRPGTDAKTNVRDAAEVAASPSLPDSVYLSFSGMSGRPSHVHSGTAARKRVASGRAFYSIGREHVAEVVRGRVELRDPPGARHPVALTGRVADVHTIELEPGVNFDQHLKYMTDNDIRGVVVTLYASATGPDNDRPYSLPKFIEAAQAKGIVVVGTLGEPRLVKLRLALGTFTDPSAVKTLMARDIVGELNAARTAQRPGREVA